MARTKVEFAVLGNGAGLHPQVHKGGLASVEEAEAWRVALTITLARTDREYFLATNGMISRSSLWIGRREITSWERVASEVASHTEAPL